MQEISGLRFAQSYLTPDGDEELSQVIDFQLGPRMGIAIHWVLGTIDGILDDDPAVSTTAFLNHTVVQALHLETGTIENVLNQVGEDTTDIDTEVFFRQVADTTHSYDTTNHKVALSVHITPSSVVYYPEPVLSARNLTHSAEAKIANAAGNCHVLIAYKYVEFSLSEMGLLLARRS